MNEVNREGRLVASSSTAREGEKGGGEYHRSMRDVPFLPYLFEVGKREYKRKGGEHGRPGINQILFQDQGKELPLKPRVIEKDVSVSIGHMVMWGKKKKGGRLVFACSTLCPCHLSRQDTNWEGTKKKGKRRPSPFFSSPTFEKKGNGKNRLSVEGQYE